MYKYFSHTSLSNSRNKIIIIIVIAFLLWFLFSFYWTTGRNNKQHNDILIRTSTSTTTTTTNKEDENNERNNTKSSNSSSLELPTQIPITTTATTTSQHSTLSSSLLYRYVPPKTPKLFESYLFPTTTTSNSNNIKESKDDNNNDEYITMMKSKSRCIKHTNIVTQFLTCRFENICLNRRGEWILFSTNPDLVSRSGKPFVYANAYFFDNPSHYFKVRVEKPFSLLKHSSTLESSTTESSTETSSLKTSSSITRLKQVNNGTALKIHDKSEIEFSSNFKWIKTPTFGLARHSIGNMGHAMLDNFIPLFTNMMNYEYVNEDNHILFLDDMYPIDSRPYEERLRAGIQAEKASMEWSELISKNRPLQLCSNSSEGIFIGNAPCENVKSFDDKELQKHGHEIDSCFSSMIVGSHYPYFTNSENREHVFPPFRNYITKFIDKQPTREYFEKEHKTLMIAVQNKPLNSGNKDAIFNVEAIVQYMTSHSQYILEQVNMDRKNKFDNVSIINLKLEEMNLKEQVAFFTILDVYITTQGSASYYGLFMMNPNAVLIYVPMCFSQASQCSDHNIRIHRNFTNVKLVSLVDHIHLVECVTFNVTQPVIRPVTMTQDTKGRFYGDCHEKLEPIGLTSLVINSLQD